MFPSLFHVADPVKVTIAELQSHGFIITQRWIHVQQHFTTKMLQWFLKPKLEKQTKDKFKQNKTKQKAQSRVLLSCVRICK